MLANNDRGQKIAAEPQKPQALVRVVMHPATNLT